MVKTNKDGKIKIKGGKKMKKKLIWNGSWFGNYENKEGLLINPEDVEVCNEVEEEKIYRYWDGSNWKTVLCYNETEIVISDDYVNLDEWDGRNFVTGGVGRHEKVYKVYEVDGEKVDDKFMVLFSSQWQGDHDLAELMDIDELKQHLVEINRDVDEYIPQVFNIA